MDLTLYPVTAEVRPSFRRQVSLRTTKIPQSFGASFALLAAQYTWWSPFRCADPGTPQPRPSENYPRPGSKGQYKVLQTTHHSGSIIVDVSIKSRFLETLQKCIDLSSFCFAKSLFEIIFNLKTLLPWCNLEYLLSC